MLAVTAIPAAADPGDDIVFWCSSETEPVECWIGTRCDTAQYHVKLCIEIDYDSATSFVEAKSDTNLDSHVHVQRREFANVNFPCAWSHVAYGGIGLNQEVGRTVCRSIGQWETQISHLQAEFMVEDVFGNPDSALELCDAYVTATVLSFGPDRFPIKTACNLDLTSV